MIDEMPARLVVVGQGYVGLALAVRAARRGFDVVGYETDKERVAALAAGRSYIEDVTSAELAEIMADGGYRPTPSEDDCAGFDIAVITVPTPLNEGAPDLSFIETAGWVLARHLRPSACVVLESTTYPGTTEEFLGPILETGSGLVAGRDFHLGYSPERIDPGNSSYTLANTPKVVSGVNAESLAAVKGFYDRLTERTVPVSGTREAEMTKLLENTFRHVNIALVNEMAVFARDLGVDMWEAVEAAATKPFGFLRFDPGPGVGGHCLPIDPVYLAWRVQRELGYRARFVDLANDVNEHMPDYVVQRLTLGLNGRRRAVNGSRVLILGMSYKRNTADLRESPALKVASRALALGANVVAVDPFVSPESVALPVEWADLTAAELTAADAVVLLTDHDVFDFSLVAAKSAYVLDTRHRVPAAAAVEYL
jgi:UDP-N-acetyl-D-glucosamine dehydrogenase